MSTATVLESQEIPFVDIRNDKEGTARFDFSINGKGLFANDQDIIAEIQNSSSCQERGFAFAAWEWLVANRYSFTPYSGDAWQHAPYLFMNSLGFGLCDDVSSIYYFLVSSVGYEARVWMIEGHVIPEVFNNGRWEIYDPDLRALYITDAGEIAGYDYLSTTYGVDYEANLLASEYAGEVFPVEWAYYESLIGLYQSTENNVISDFAMTRQDAFGRENLLVDLPAHSFARIHAYDGGKLTTIYGDVVPDMSVLEVHFGALEAFEFEYPLVPFRISGEGSVLIDGVEYVIGSEELDARLASRSVPVTSIIANTTGSDNVISYLINPIRFALDGTIDVALEGDVNALSVILSGGSGDDTLSGVGGADTLVGGGGADWLTQTAATVNSAAGSRLEGGAGDDRIEFVGSQAYTSNYVFLSGGEGDDVIRAGTAQSQYVGAIQIEGGAGADLIEVGHIEGSTGGLGYVSGGEGNDVLRVLDTWNGIGIWGNSTFRLLGDGGDDRFELAGTQLNIVGGEGGAQLDGGAGFDTLVWNGRYNLTIGGSQNPDVGLYAGYRQELKVTNVELIDLAASGATGLTVRFSAQDVATITADSDFDRSTLGLGLSGTGNTLFVNAGSNQVDLTGFVEVGGAVVGGQEYGIYRSGEAYLGVLSDLTLTGSAAADTLRGYGGNDTLSGGGGADTLVGGGGADWLTQTAATVNGAAGSRLEGGAGDDRIEFVGSQAYTSNHVFLSGGDGNDVIRAGTAQSQYVGAIQIEGGAGADLIEVGHIEGSTGGRGYISGGEGNDVLRVLDTWGGIGIWGNSTFRLLGDGGDDRFELAGTQLTIPAGDGQVALDGGAGFDTLVWNGRYNLTIGGSQNPDVGLYAGYRQELKVTNVELIDLAASGATGLTVRFNAQDVATLTAGSDFDRATLGLGLSGTGNTLFVNAGSNQVDLTGFVEVGGAVVGGQEYGIYRSGDAYLGVLSDLTLTGSAAADTLRGYGGNDTLSGGGGADTLLGGGGADWLTQAAATVNGAAGSRLEGGAGDDRIEFVGSQAYTSNHVFLSGGDGNDVIRAGTAQSQYVGSIQIEGGAGADLIEVGHIEGSTGGRGYISGGEGNDVLRVLDTWGGIGIWGNSTFRLLGDGGDDRFELAGTQLTIPAGDGQVALDGGAGFDTLVWNGRYNLTIGGSQNPDVGLYAGYRQELKVTNVELIDLAASGATGLTVRFSAQDVATLTANSDFDRATLGLGLSGTGSTLFVNAGSNQVDLTGFVEVGGAVVGGQEYGIYRSGDAYLGVLSDLTLTGSAAADTLRGYGGNDTLSGGGGADTLIGGTGADTFVFQSLADFLAAVDPDVIIDFRSGEDRIDLTAIDANGLVDGNQTFEFISTSLFSGSAGELRFDDVDQMLIGDVDGDAVADFQIALLGVASLTESDLLL